MFDSETRKALWTRELMIFSEKGGDAKWRVDTSSCGYLYNKWNSPGMARIHGKMNVRVWCVKKIKKEV